MYTGPMSRLPLALLVACAAEAPPEQSVELLFTLTSGETPVGCTTPLDGDARLQDARFYISDLALVTAAGREVPITLAPDGLFQSERVALIDLEARCETSGTEAVHASVRGTVAQGTYTGLAFGLGVPFELNHLDGTTAPPPLDNTAMYWGWQIGYKFLRLDLALPAGAFNLHLGSIGCVSDSAVRPPEGCARPNRVRVRLDAFDASKSAVTLDLTALLKGVDIEKNTEGTPPGCQSDPSEADDCAGVFAHLGLDFATGEPSAAQTAFRVVPR